MSPATTQTRAVMIEGARFLLRIVEIGAPVAPDAIMIAELQA